MSTLSSFERLAALCSEIAAKDRWKQKQTILSFYPFILEEARELEEAVKNNDANELKEELGDLMWDILHISMIAERDGLFTLHDVLDGVHQKMTERHPHVIGEGAPREMTQGEWNSIKQRQNERKKGSPAVPITLPIIPSAVLPIRQEKQERINEGTA